MCCDETDGVQHHLAWTAVVANSHSIVPGFHWMRSQAPPRPFGVRSKGFGYCSACRVEKAHRTEVAAVFGTAAAVFGTVGAGAGAGAGAGTVAAAAAVVAAAVAAAADAAAADIAVAVPVGHACALHPESASFPGLDDSSECASARPAASCLRDFAPFPALASPR